MQNLRRKVFELSDRLFIQTHELQRVVIIDERRDVDHLVIFFILSKKIKWYAYNCTANSTTRKHDLFEIVV